MIPVAQTTFRPSEGDGAGNCFQAALASVMELPLDDVPNFAGFPRATWQEELDAWLAARGLALLPLETRRGMPWVPAGSWVLIVGRSPRGDFAHCIVGHVEEGMFAYAHDPHPSRAFIDGDPTTIWVFLTLDPARPPA